ncbi:hypothetical protein [Streptomyces sp. NPDC004783]|uniref:hypothetical protein n=1 Tax=Streptomyces sp. NPDC004783 TaxID=3154459 RepID=UPI0033BBA33E
MALVPVPIATLGAEHSAQQFRMMIKDLARDNQGVTTGSDLKVTALSTPGAGVQIGDGSAVIAGKVSPVQGYYNAYNIGSDTVDISATGGTGRSDMLVLRVEDPEYEGTRDPAVDPIVFFQVIPNVSSSATTPPAGYSAVPLARIDIPASTATITNAMIKDLRQVANPRRDRIVTPYYYTGAIVSLSGTSTTWVSFPNVVLANLAIPSWAATAKIVFSATNLILRDGNVFSGFRFMLGTTEAAQVVWIDDNQGTGFRRHFVEMVETLDLTTTAGAAMRGTTQPIRARMRLDPVNAGKIQVDTYTTFKIDVEFSEGRL